MHNHSGDHDRSHGVDLVLLIVFAGGVKALYCMSREDRGDAQSNPN